MCQNSGSTNGCGGTDYSLQTGNTGTVTISAANPNLDGSGDVETVLTAGSDGTIIKAVTIKAIQSVTTGMVRLFIANADSSIISLYKEVPVSTDPSLSCVPLPSPVLPTFEIKLLGDIKLDLGFSLLASTQNAEAFNVIAEGLDWTYPGTLPTYPSNFKQQFANTGLGTVSVANTNLDGRTGTYVSIFTADSDDNGAMISAVTVKALQSTHAGMVRLFVSPDGGTSNYLITEISVPETDQSAYTPSFKQTLSLNYYLEAGYSIYASTQLAESFAITIEGADWSYPIS